MYEPMALMLERPYDRLNHHRRDSDDPRETVPPYSSSKSSWNSGLQSCQLTMVWRWCRECMSPPRAALPQIEVLPLALFWKI